jgi:hypothetical protein
MKPSTHIELIKKALDEMFDEHPLNRGAWPIYNDIREDLEKLEREMNRMDLVQEKLDGPDPTDK